LPTLILSRLKLPISPTQSSPRRALLHFLSSSAIHPSMSISTTPPIWQQYTFSSSSLDTYKSFRITTPKLIVITTITRHHSDDNPLLETAVLHLHSKHQIQLEFAYYPHTLCISRILCHYSSPPTSVHYEHFLHLRYCLLCKACSILSQSGYIEGFQSHTELLSSPLQTGRHR